MPTRGSEKIKEMVRWRDHFEAARDVPIHTITLDTGSLDATIGGANFSSSLGCSTKKIECSMT